MVVHSLSAVSMCAILSSHDPFVVCTTRCGLKAPSLPISPSLPRSPPHVPYPTDRARKKGLSGSCKIHHPPLVGRYGGSREGAPPDHKRSDTALMAFTLSRRRRLTQESLRAVLFYDPGRRKGFGIFCSFVGMQCTIATGAHTCRVVCTFLKILFKQK